MSVHDVWLRDTLSRYAIIAVTAVLVIVWVKVKWPKFKQYVYKSYLVGFEAECAQLALPYKTNLFRLIERQQSQDASLRSVGKIRILEIGVKTGENIQYYPHGAHVICVDWNRKLEEYLVNGNCCNKFAHIVLENLVIGDGTCMKNVADGSVDIVVSTRSLCSTASISKTLKEIKRVMAPGGQFLFMEHIAEPKGTLTEKLQTILTNTGLWPTFFGGCRLNINPLKKIETCGFKQVLSKQIMLDGYVSQPLCLSLTRKHIIGVAMK